MYNVESHGQLKWNEEGDCPNDLLVIYIVHPHNKWIEIV